MQTCSWWSRLPFSANAEKLPLKLKTKDKNNDGYSRYCEILFGVPPGSIEGPLLFKIFLCDMFYDINVCDIASRANDNTLYASSSNLDAVINKLDETNNSLLQRFRNNHMKVNADKCHLLVTGNYEVSKTSTVGVTSTLG